MDIIAKLTQELRIRQSQTEAAVKLLDEGNTVPFIARYRKEMTGSLDDEVLRNLSERLAYLRSLDEQREKVRASITEQEKMTDEISAALDAAETLTEIEDIYRPFRPKRRTRASVAKEKGLEPLALLIYAQDEKTTGVLKIAEQYTNEEKGVASAEDALQGALDIIAETISDDAEGRKRIRYVCMQNGSIRSAGAKDDLGVYGMYADKVEKLNKVPGHRVLAMNRGEKEEFLKISVEFDRNMAMRILASIHVKNNGETGQLVLRAADDAYDRLIFPSIEREIRNELTDKASTDAIKVFAENTRHLLMQPPVRNAVTIGLDPGYRTGCKVAVVDGTGKVLDTGVIYPVPPHNRIPEAKAKIKTFIQKYGVTCIAIGNGTASHETETFTAELLKEMNAKGVSYMVVSEAGASVYSASKLAQQEFPDFDVTQRSAVSIARRLQDPLAELVKIDPKAIGVGQYQHDMPEKQLGEALDGVVEDCVNSVGADLNTASAPLLARIAGINSAIAKNIVAYREENGKFISRAQLKKVPKLGPKAFEQCAGFLRVTDGRNVLDRTAVHPESYDAAEALLKHYSYTDSDVAQGRISGLSERVSTDGTSALAAELGIGEPTLIDIVKELERPARDPRDELPPPMLRTDVMGIEDLKPGMEMKGTVRNVIDFGAFVDIGVHQDGLVHVTQISDRYIKHPSEVLKVGDIVTVWVLAVDTQKGRISLTMKKPKQ
ncbi:MAG: RNA-binding transcriptional accessory protein [Clostridia bacterium]|nr:RNA-binding transcriptional accessory protein [Clostridia bacterium]